MIFGSGLFGRVHKCRNGVHLGTKFIHICFLPLYPENSYIVTHSDFIAFSGVKIKPYKLSIFIAYFRGLCCFLIFLALSFVLIYIMIWPLIDKINTIALAILNMGIALGVLSIIGLIMSFVSTKISTATPEIESWIFEQIAQSELPNKSFNPDPAAKI